MNGVGGSSQLRPGQVTLRNNTFAGRGQHAIRFGFDSLRIEVTNNLFVNAQSAVHLSWFTNTPRVQFRNNAFWNNEETIHDTDHDWSSVGLMTTVNANGDSTDVYGNLFRDPLFADTVTFALEAGSPCVDAGVDVGLPYWGAAPDIGWWESELDAAEDIPFVPFESGLRCNPNPFNAITQIRYSLPHEGRVSLRVFDLLGREVAVLVDERRSAGEHAVAFDAGALPSGLYFARVDAAGQRQTRKLVLLK